MGEWPWIVVHSSGDQDYPVSVLSIFKIHNLLTLITIKEACFTTSMITFQVTDGSNQGGCGGTLIADNWVGNFFVSLYRKSLLRYKWVDVETFLSLCIETLCKDTTGLGALYADK